MRDEDVVRAVRMTHLDLWLSDAETRFVDHIKRRVLERCRDLGSSVQVSVCVCGECTGDPEHPETICLGHARTLALAQQFKEDNELEEVRSWSVGEDDVVVVADERSGSATKARRVVLEFSW